MTRPVPSTRTAQVRRNPVLIGGVVALAIVASLMAALVMTRPSAAGAVDPTPTPVPSVPATPEPSSEPINTPEPAEDPIETPTPVVPVPAEDPGPTPVIDAPDGILPPGSVVRVTVEAIKLRMGPSTDTEFLGTIDLGDLVVVELGHVEAEGFIWYQVSPLGLTELPDVGTPLPRRMQLAWAVVGNGTESFVEPVAARCVEGDVDLPTLNTMLAWERLACFGDGSITLEGTFGCGGCGGFTAGVYEPYWIASPMNYNFLTHDFQGSVGPFVLHFAPNGPERPDDGSILRVTGHFGDAAASECVVKPGVDETTINSAVEDLHCQEQFVVDSYEVIGFNEDFPLS